MMTPRTATLSAAALTLAGVAFLLYAALRPWHDETTVAGAVAAMSSTAWVVSHLLAMIGFITLPLAPVAVYAAVRHQPAASRTARAAIGIMWIGVGLTLPYYGAETFGLHAGGTSAADGDPIDILGLAEAVRFEPVAVTMFGVGLIAIAAGAILTAVAAWRSEGALPRTSAVVFAVAFAMFLPQFFTPAPIRIAHGILVAVGCAWLAVALYRSTPAMSQPAMPASSRSEKG